MKLARLARSAGFRLALAHAGIFALVIAVLFWIVYWATSSYAHTQLTESIRLEGYELATQMRREGIAPVAATINARLLASGEPNLAYLLTDAAGRKIAGNLQPASLAAGWQMLRRPADGSLGPADEDDPFLVEVTELPDGGKLVVGADTHPREELLEWIVAAFSWAGGAAILVALAGGLVLGLSMSRRVEAMNDAAVRIIGGDLGERLAVRGTGDEFDRLAIQLNRMLDRIQALMEGLRQVSNDIAHDLRTPLSRLRQHLERTHDRSATLDEYQDAVERAIGETDAILATFAALLRIAQIEAGGRRQGFATVDLSELAQRIGEAYGPVAEEQGRLLHSWIDPGVIVRGDGELLTQVLSNLIENVLCHTPASTPVELKVHPRGNQAVMAVADRGSGVPAGDRARILKRFVRLDGSRSTPGSGLGLSLVAAVAELHGARLRLEDHQPGLCVELEFPQHGTKQA